MQEPGRPEPEAVLATLRTEQRGRLRIYLGAAPGVGKTYAMLQAARERVEQGLDLVVGVVETHGRAETAALLEGLEVLPRKQVEYRGHRLEEMDLDQLLERCPALAVVDELAHTNAPGSRHPKRYLDVEELIEAGIDVWTTCNIQHVESLNDAVVQITGMQVREKVPDRLFELADELELVDLAPEDLLERLEQGKVYVPDLAAQAIRRFFRPGNLTALRELALRQTAQRVGGQMRSYMAAHAIPGPWPTHERLLVCVSPSPLSPRLVRTARRMAERRQCEWLAVYVETPRHYQLSEADQDRVAETLRLAEELGGEVLTAPGEDLAETVVTQAKARNATEIIVGRSHRPRWHELLFGSVVLDIIEQAGDIDVYVVTGETAEAHDKAGAVRGRQRPSDGPLAWLSTLLAVTGAALLAALIRSQVPLPNLSMVFLLPVLYSAATWGLLPSLFASVVSLLVYDFFFVPPQLTLTVAQPQDVLALVMYLVGAVVTSNLTARLRTQVLASRRREQVTAALYALSREIAAAGELQTVLRAVVTKVAELLSANVIILLPVGDKQEGLLAPRTAYPSSLELTEEELAAATWAWQHGRPSGRGTDTLPGIAWLCLSLNTARGPLGVLAVQAESERGFGPGEQRLLRALAGLAALAIERADLVAELRQA